MARYNRRDPYFQRAKKDQFAARSVYKLEELDRRFRLFSKGQRIVDLGCAPGSWLQYIALAIAPKGAVVAYDIVAPEVNAGPGSFWAVEDVHNLTPERIRADLAHLVGEPPAEAHVPVADGLVSDMAPKLTGIRDADQARSVALTSRALELAHDLVKPGGFYVAKLFQGRDTDEFIRDVKQAFKSVKLLKPDATRDGSREVFVVAQTRRDL